MASSSQPRKSRRPQKTKKPRRTHFKKRLIQPKDRAAFDHISPPEPEIFPFITLSSSTTSSSVIDASSGLEEEKENLGANANANAESGCCTPKAHRFRIPEIATCPPAPKKQRVMRNCSLRRRPIAFFAPPDIELFFVFALREQQQLN